jgi:hypothetical protein
LFPFKATLKFCGLLILAIVLVLLPADFFDGSTAICLSRVLLDMECYACGMTRACMRIIHFQFGDAWGFNPLSYLVMPLLSFMWAREVIQSGRKIFRHQKG